MLLAYDSYLQGEMVAVVDEASRLYKKKLQLKNNFAKGDRKEMAKATIAVVRSFWKKNDKMFAVVDLTNEDDFMVGVCSYTKFSKIIVICFIFYFYFYLWIFCNAD